MKNILLLIVFSVIGFLLPLQKCFAQSHGKLLIHNYNQIDIKSGSGAFWCLVKDKRGVVYVGGENEVFEFDGITWNKIPMPNRSVVRSLAIDKNGVIFVGAVNEFGYLEPDATGKLKYISLLEKIPEKNLAFPDIWSINFLNDDVLFQSPEKLFIYSKNKISVIDLSNSYHRSAVVNNRYYVNQRGIGLTTLDEGTLKPVPEGDFFKYMIVSSITKFDNSTLLIGTRKDGLFIYKQINASHATIIPFENEANSYLKFNSLYHTINLPGNRFAFATLVGGVIVCDAKGSILKCIKKETGLNNSAAYFLNLYNNDELWITSSKGVSYTNIDYPISYWNEDLGLNGLVTDITKYNEKLYVGTYSGFYTLNLAARNFTDDQANGPNRFTKVGNVKNEVCEFLKFNPNGIADNSSNTKLLASVSMIGLYNVTDGKVEFPVENNGKIELCQSSKDPSIIYMSSQPAFYVLQNVNNRWVKRWEKNINSHITSIVEDLDGNVWIGTNYYGVYKIEMGNVLGRFGDNPNGLLLDNVAIKNYGLSDGLTDLSYSMVFLFHNELLITSNGIFSYDKEQDKIVRSKLFESEIVNWDKLIYAFSEDNNGNIWGFESALLDKQRNGDYKIVQFPFVELTLKNAALYFYHDTNCTWIAGDNGLFKYDNYTISSKSSGSFCTLIRNVSIDKDSVIFNGAYFEADKVGRMYVSCTQPKSLATKISSKNKSISFNYSSPFFSNDIPLKYSHFLDGYDQAWSEWSYNTKKEYTNLNGGSYTFRVRAINYLGVISDEASYTFVVATPWYRTKLSLSLIVIIFLFLSYSITRMYVAQYKQRNLMLENKIKERTHKLELQKEEINQQAEKLQVQNEKLQNQKNRIIEISKEIVETNSNKLQFFTNISHEIRTPLTLISGPIEELIKHNESYTNEEKLSKYLLIQRNTGKLLSLVNQILEFRKIESYNPKLDAVEGNIVTFVKELASCFDEVARENRIDYVIQADQENIKTYFDREKIEKILFNLISNAFKFTNQGGKITIRLQLTEVFNTKDHLDKMVEISVVDTGIGIPENVIPKIFDRFYHSSRSISLNQAGSGLGLSLAAKLAEIHHGKIKVDSIEGNGSTFTLFIPYGKEYLHDEEINRDVPVPDESVLKDIKAGIPELKYYNFQPHTYAHTDEVLATKEQGRRTILLVEDNDDMRHFIKSSLKDKFQIIEAVNGMKGLELARKFLPDAIVSDVMMSEMDGYEFCSKLKANNDTSQIPVILLTAKTSDEDFKQGFDVGADDYISKPFNIEVLEARIRNLIKLRKKLRDTYSREVFLKPTDIKIASSDEKFLTKAMKIIEKNISDPNYNIDQFSKDMAMSQSSLYRRLKSLTGESPNIFIKEIRLKRAASLLIQNEIPVSDVSGMVGFDDPSYFSKSFKQKYGVSPFNYSKGI
jgi:signal transduction histidine kinase/CheY-like chemotaxis protein/AraC-like DNA-binding protein/ligand-binding sensor domain-containing protein